MKKIRVLIIDDAAVVRRILADILSSDPMIEVAGSAANGRIGLTKIPQVNPDLITLDIEMPEMDGLQTLAELRKTYPNLPVIMFSTLTERGAIATLDALSLGANDYVTKPANVGSLTMAMQHIKEELIPKIKALCSKVTIRQNVTVPVLSFEPRVPAIWTPTLNTRRADILAIGVSTGGPNALSELLSSLPDNFPVPIMIVQHMPPFFTKLLAERLSQKSKFDVQEGVSGAILKAGCAWIAPGDYHMTLEVSGNVIRIKTHQQPPENSCRPAVDPLFRSVAEIYGSRSLAVVLTGMGQDGLQGCKHIHSVGGQILVQDEATSVVWGMPGFVAKAGIAEKILPLNQLASEIVRRVNYCNKVEAINFQFQNK